ncbi:MULTISPECIES: plastocyanin/azurin family copper-binding protein [Halorussus]|uniref:plastocyanin/azurin family copper-binding protein n=1 Tax=Halorussus TaxID=1070314 RepID=UPI000E2126A6|nr:MULTISPECIES: plastocyanin/azurin family copper-binding protein [Halorussus]NHN59978.1 halocyanin [Halorussus sp. JP-T4]
MSRDFRSDRRAMLKAGGAVLVAGGLAGCTAGGQDSPGKPTSGSGTTPAGDATTTDAEEPTDAETTASSGESVTVEVGPGGRLAFEPSGDRPLVVGAGTTVEFVWKSDSHSVVVDRQPGHADWQGSPGGAGEVYDEGYSFSHTFEEPGIYEFHCEAHETVGMTGAIFVTPEGVTPEYATEDGLPVTVGPGGALTFSPGTVRPLKVPTGTEVKFVWDSDTHNIRVRDRPEGADWTGTTGDADEMYDEGHEHGHTFETPGVYWFYCLAHRSVGMVGAIVVGEKDEK